MLMCEKGSNNNPVLQIFIIDTRVLFILFVFQDKERQLQIMDSLMKNPGAIREFRDFVDLPDNADKGNSKSSGKGSSGSKDE